jgi:hypothetical protein
MLLSKILFVLSLIGAYVASGDGNVANTVYFDSLMICATIFVVNIKHD